MSTDKANAAEVNELKTRVRNAVTTTLASTKTPQATRGAAAFVLAAIENGALRIQK